jgi:hypothetical protein
MFYEICKGAFMPEALINPQRANNYWEPIYEPHEQPYASCGIDITQFEHLPSLERYIIDLAFFNNLKFILNKSFSRIDFIGSIDGGRTTKKFENCTFFMCSFRTTNFSNIKFTSCTFDRTTFSMASFKNCQFRNCIYKEIGISGNTTSFEDVYIDAEKLLSSIYLCKDKALLKERKTNRLYQKMRLMKTKSVVANNVLSMKPVKADIDMLIKGIRTSRKYESTSKLEESFYNLVRGEKKAKLKNLFNALFYFLEIPIIFYFGWLSGWGQKVGKAILIGLITTIIFAFLYTVFLVPQISFSEALLRSIEYLLLFGYTKYYFIESNTIGNTLIFLNAIIGMLWYAALIPSVINKLGKEDE